ncbi:hypothetical protein [Spiroplasma alleghenense]|uniref:DUF1461 domain-containing protein n=1 Tax=Spiroplasma alleghenense TaxID=216931 RepID=A0A345Z4R5_9MOLU|nr:hypothetical protein [Spiroplasma alleghenense]AXK51594.1 hypothetical protein SALLE_v1c09240 [Spiroplasma alleghenense]
MKILKIPKYKITIAYQLIMMISIILASLPFFLIGGSKVFIKDMPGIESYFFNEFQVNGVSIYKTAYLSTEGVYSSIFGFSNFTSGHTLMLYLTSFGIFFLWGPIGFLAWSPPSEVWTKKTLIWTSVVEFILFIFLIVIYSISLSGGCFNRTFNDQIFKYFGKDFFSTDELQNQLQVLRESINQVFNYNSFAISSAFAIVFALISALTIIAWWIYTYLYTKFEKRSNNKNDVVYQG